MTRVPLPFQRGQKIPGFDADFLNALREVVAAFDRGALFGGQRPEQEAAPVRRVRITADAPLPAFSVLGIDAPLATEAQNANALKFNPGYLVSTPTVSSGHDKNFVIIQEPGRLAPSLVAALGHGETTARVNVSDTSHGFAKVETGSTDLVSAPDGPVILRYPATATGLQLCQVFIGPGSGAITDHHYKTPSGGIPKATQNASTGAITMGMAWCERYDLDESTGILSLSGYYEWVYNSMPNAIAGNKTVNTQLERGLPVVIVEPCEEDYDTGTGMGGSGPGMGTGFSSGFGGTGFSTGFTTGMGA